MPSNGPALLNNALITFAAFPVIKTWILAEYVGKGIDNLKVQNLDAMSPEQAVLAGELFLKLNRVDIKSIRARGKGDYIVVRVEITPDGKTPPDGKRIRYLRIKAFDDNRMD